MSEVVRTVCQSCHSECGVLAHVENGRVVRLQGDPDHPNNKGYICIKGKAEPQRLYHPDRLLHPLKRVGARGEGRWQQVAWDEALDGIAAGLTAVRDRYGADAICGMRGTGPRAGGVSNLVPYALGSPNAISSDLHICYAPSLIAENVTIGTSVLMERGPDYENARCILIFGANPMVSHPPRGRDVMRGRVNNGAKLIVVDPRRTYLAGKADLWLQIRPGTDAALVLGLINLVIEQGLYDKEFVERWCVGFAELSARAAEYPVERVAEITWLPAEKIREAARLYATTKPAVLHHRVAMDQNLCSTQSSRAMIDLVAITGNLDVEGGNLLPPKIPGYYRSGILSGGAVCAPPPEVEERRLGAERFPLTASPRGRFCGGPTLMFVHAHVGMEAMEGKAAHPLKAMYCSGGNPVVTTMDVRRFRDAMLNLDLLVVADYFMTPTAEIADYVLPATTWLERDELCDDGYTDYIAARQKAVEPQGEARDDLAIVMDLVGRIPWADRARIPWDSPAECYDWMVAGHGPDLRRTQEGGLLPGATPLPQVRAERVRHALRKGRARGRPLRGPGLRSAPRLRGAFGEPGEQPGTAGQIPAHPDQRGQADRVHDLRGPAGAGTTRPASGPGDRDAPADRGRSADTRGRLGMVGDSAQARGESQAQGQALRRHRSPGGQRRLRLVVPRAAGHRARLF